MARNFIGNSVDTSSTAYDHLASDNVLTLNTGDRIKIDSGARAGDIYQYLGQPVTVPVDFTTAQSPAVVKRGQNVEVLAGTDGATANTVYQYVGTPDLSHPDLATEDYSDADLWHQITALQQDYSNVALWRQTNLNSDPLQVQAYVVGSGVNAAASYALTANSHQNINALVLGLSAAVAGSGGLGVSVSGSGVYAANQIATDVQAYHDGGTTTGAGINAASVNFGATDTSTIIANAAAASVAATLAGGSAISVSIGLSIALNQIDNDVEAYIANATTGVTTTSGAISLSSKEDAVIHATSIAASLAAALSPEVSVGVSGAGADATNVIFGLDNAFATNSTLTSAAAITIAAEDRSDIEATILAVAVGVGVGSNGIGAAIGAAVAENFIGHDLSGDLLPLQVEAYALNSGVHAAGAYTLTATSQQTITAITVAGSVAVAGGADGSGALSGSGVFTENEMAAAVQAYHSGDGSGTGAGVHAASIAFGASDTSQITSNAAAVSLATALDATAAISVSLGLSLASNTIDNDVEAYIANASHGVTTTSGGIALTATESSIISAVSAAAAAAAAGSLGVGVAISGAGAEATNSIVGKDNAYVNASNLTSATTVALDAEDASQITAKIIGAAASVGIGVGVGGVAVSIGAAVAENFIGYDAGGNLSPMQVMAYAQNSGISAKGAYTLTANSNQQINALVLALSASVAGGLGAGVAASGSGAYAENQIAVDAQAYQDGDGSGTGAGISAASVTFSADDISTVIADVGAVSLAGSVAGGGALSIAIGLSLATNAIDNDVEADIADASHGVTTTSGGISLTSKEDASIDATSAAAALAIAGALGVGVAISGAGAEATNVILGKDNAYVNSSNLISAAGVTISTEDTSAIEAMIIAAAASGAAAGGGGAGASIGAAVAENFLGYNADGSAGSLEIMAYAQDSSISAQNDLTVAADSDQAITALVLAGAVAVAGALGLGLAVSGAGVYSKNSIGATVKAYIDGDGAPPGSRPTT